MVFLICNNGIIILGDIVLENTFELLKKFEDNGYKAYIVGGFVRDYILGIKSVDIDIATSATPKEIQSIFKNVELPFEGYGSVFLTFKKYKYEVTTFRMDLEYKNNRHPSKIIYTDKLEIDLKRRDFTMNTLAMDKDGNVIDLLNSTRDIKIKLIKTVGNADFKLKEDSLRILRAIRFATTLGFNLSDDLKNAIGNNRKLLKDLSFYRKKQELNKIFSSPNVIEGIKLLKKFKLDYYLDINLDNQIVRTNDPIGIWAQINPSLDYQFTNNELSYLKAIRRILEDKKIDNEELYYDGTYVCYIAGQILGIDEKDIYDKFDNLPIRKKEDIKLSAKDMIDYLNLDDKSNIKDIFKDVELSILNNRLKNEEENIKRYLKNKYMI